jgi:hypothetical protein
VVALHGGSGSGRRLPGRVRQPLGFPATERCGRGAKHIAWRSSSETYRHGSCASGTTSSARGQPPASP